MLGLRKNRLPAPPPRKTFTTASSSFKLPTASQDLAHLHLVVDSQILIFPSWLRLNKDWGQTGMCAIYLASECGSEKSVLTSTIRVSWREPHASDCLIFHSGRFLFSILQGKLTSKQEIRKQDREVNWVKRIMGQKACVLGTKFRLQPCVLKIQDPSYGLHHWFWYGSLTHVNR